MTRTARGTTAFVAAFLLLGAGALTLVGSRYISRNVHHQLVAQDTPSPRPAAPVFPPTSSPAAVLP